MKRLALLVLVATVAGCDTGQPLTTDAVVAELRGAGFEVVNIRPAYSLGEVGAQDVEVNGAPGNVYTFGSLSAREQWDAQFSADGSNVRVLGREPWALALGDEDQALADQIAAKLGLGE